MAGLPSGLPPWMYGINDIQLRKGQAADEGGIDLGTNKIGQQLQALNDGTIVGAGYFCHGGPYFMTEPSGNGCGAPGYGVVTIRMDTPYGPQDVYYQHINIDKSIQLCSGNCPGQKVKKGQVIGTAGVGNPPQNLLEMGVNVPWGGIWGTNHPGPWVDPEAIIRSLMANYGSNTTTFTAAGGSNSSSTGGSDPLSVLTGWFTGTLGPQLKVWGEYAAIFILALILIVVGFVLLNERAAGQLIRKAA